MPRAIRRPSRRGWENPCHRPSGWFGDAEGHSEASRRGWEHDHRGYSGDDDDYDRGYHRSRSRHEDDDEDYDRRGHGVVAGSAIREDIPKRPAANGTAAGVGV